LRAANVLLIGIRGLGSEIAKNILLSGINSLTILDDGVVTESDILHNFLLHEKVPVGSKVSIINGSMMTKITLCFKIAEEVLPRAQSLNPLVKIATDTEPVSAKSADYFKEFTIVVATKIKFEHILKIDNVCREHSVKFIYGDVFGFFGFSVSDLQEHDYFE
jgi:ubiquitin-like 1-activating enzyme E1 A